MKKLESYITKQPMFSLNEIKRFLKQRTIQFEERRDDFKPIIIDHVNLLKK